MTVRQYWLDTMLRVCEPVLLQTSMDAQFRRAMPIETAAGTASNPACLPRLEALARSLAGMAPWLALVPDAADADEVILHTRFSALAVAALNDMLSPASPDGVDALPAENPQVLVESAILAMALLRAPDVLWARLEPDTQSRLLKFLRRSRDIRPLENNWLLFPAMVEAALQTFSGDGAWPPIRRGLREFRNWYAGDGMYRDGPTFHCDYYNSYIIHPMLLMLARHAEVLHARPQAETALVFRRAQRHAEVLERLIATDGTFPPLGRSMAYRCGAFHLLAQLALEHGLPASLPPAQVRSALTAVIRRTLDAPGTFDTHGWLTVGLAGHQPGIAEHYISTGSLYLCTMVFLPLGLPAHDAFWAMPEQAWTSKRAFAGRSFAIDASLDP